MSETTEIAQQAGTAVRSRPGGPFGQRRNFLVNRRYQLRTSLLTAGVVLLLLVLINLSLYSAGGRIRAEILADSPEIAERLRGYDQVELALVLAASLVFLGGVFMVGILETHKTAGAAFKIEREMAELARGSYGTTIRLRRGDNLVELEQAFNALSRTLADREHEESDRLDEFATLARTDPTGAANALLEMATRKRTRLTDAAGRG